MKRLYTLLPVLLLSIVLTLRAGPAWAQEVKTIDTTQLKSLYEQLLIDTEDTFIQKRITDERDGIRDFIEEEIQRLVAPPPEEEQLDPEEIPKALERQRTVISALQERLRERKVDLDLLSEEEKKFYTAPAPPKETADSGTGKAVNNAEKYRLTKSYDELLARKAVLEERIAVLTAVLYQQQDRLDRLVTEQRIKQFGVLITIGQYLFILLIIWIVEKSVRTKLLVRIGNAEHRYTVTKVWSSLIYIAVFTWLVATIFAKHPSILASFAIIGAGLAIALQDVVKDFLGWFLILQHRLFSTGDRITIGTVTGEVVDINMLRTTLLEVGLPPETVVEHTGKILTIPNASVLTKPVTNHSTTSEFVNAEVHITITFESNWKKAKAILEEVLLAETGPIAEREQLQLLRRTRMLYIHRKVSGPMVYYDIADDGVHFILRFPVPIGERRSVVMRLSEAVLNRFDEEPDVEFAYKTTRYYRQGEEG